jgi:hypothetical protein
LITIRRREFGEGLFASRIPCLVHDLLKGVNVHNFQARGERRGARGEHMIRENPFSYHLPLATCHLPILLHRRAVIGQFFFRHLENLGPLVVEAAILDFFDTCIQAQRLLSEVSPLCPAHV